MPNRIVREGINSSPRINRLSAGAEVLYRRLISVVDDFGRFHGSVATVRGACWPTCPDKYTERQIAAWLSECAIGERPLIRQYEVEGARYVQIEGFGQKVRSKSKFPSPAGELSADCEQSADKMLADCGQNVGTSRSRMRSRISKAEAEAQAHTAAPPVCERGPLAADMQPNEPASARFEEFWGPYPRKTKRDASARAFLSLVTTANEAAVFACLGRYLASDEVRRGVVMNPDEWLWQRSRDHWESDWPAAAGGNRTRQQENADAWSRA